MRKGHWKYLSLTLSIVGIFLILLSMFFPATFQEAGRAAYGQTVTSTFGVGEADGIQIAADGLLTVTPADLDPNNLDQHWETYSHAYAVGPMWYLQSFKDIRCPMLGFSVLISRTEVIPEEPLIIGLVASQLEGADLYDTSNWLVAGSLPADALPDQNWYWISLEFSLIVQPEETCYIVCVSNDMDPNDEHYWRWAVQYPTGGYDRGQFFIYDFDNEEWTGRNYDACFRTYSAGWLPPEPPIVQIASSYTVVSQFFGSLSLIGAVISGIKYFTLVV